VLGALEFRLPKIAGETELLLTKRCSGEKSRLEAGSGEINLRWEGGRAADSSISDAGRGCKCPKKCESNGVKMGGTRNV